MSMRDLRAPSSPEPSEPVSEPSVNVSDVIDRQRKIIVAQRPAKSTLQTWDRVFDIVRDAMPDVATEDGALEILGFIRDNYTSSQSQNQYWSSVRRVLTWIVEAGAADQSLDVDALPTIKVERSTLPTCMPDEFAALYAAATQEHRKVALVLGYYHGLRSKEVGLTTPDHLDLKEHLIRVPTVKTGRERIIPIMTHVPGVLELLRSRCQNNVDYLALVQGDKSDPTRTTFRIRLDDLCEKAGIRRLPFHSLRHGHVFWALTVCRSDLMSVSRVLGHSKLATTEGYAQAVGATVDLQRRAYQNNMPVREES